MPEAAPSAMRAPAAAGDQAAFAFHDGAILGTRMTLLVNAAAHADALAAAERARGEIDRLNRVLNWRDPSTEISRLNRSARHAASKDLFAVVAAAERWRAASSSAYSGRLGRVLDLWRQAEGLAPDSKALAKLAIAADSAAVELDVPTRTITRPDPVQFDLDGLAKGYIVDRALDAALSSPAVLGAMVDIGGDIRCAGEPPAGDAWLVGVPEPLTDYDNAPLAGWAALRDQAVATSGCGPRDRSIGPRRYSATIDPRTGWPISRQRSATVIADCAIEADALATAVLNLSPAEAGELVRATPGASALLTDRDGSGWLLNARYPAGAPAGWIPVQAKSTAPAAGQGAKWPERWVAFVTFTAPARQLKRDPGFRSPYVAIWVSDAQNRPVRTLFLVGTDKDWQRDNYIWWGLNRANAVELVSSRSFSTRVSGEYRVLWDGVDERGKRAPAGKYILHVETSRERGKHTHRSLELDLSQARAFSAELPTTDEAGGLAVSFGRF